MLLGRQGKNPQYRWGQAGVQPWDCSGILAGIRWGLQVMEIIGNWRRLGIIRTNHSIKSYGRVWILWPGLKKSSPPETGSSRGIYLNGIIRIAVKIIIRGGIENLCPRLNIHTIYPERGLEFTGTLYANRPQNGCFLGKPRVKNG